MKWAGSGQARSRVAGSSSWDLPRGSWYTLKSEAPDTEFIGGGPLTYQDDGTGSLYHDPVVVQNHKLVYWLPYSITSAATPALASSLHILGEFIIGPINKAAGLFITYARKKSNLTLGVTYNNVLQYGTSASTYPFYHEIHSLSSDPSFSTETQDFIWRSGAYLWTPSSSSATFQGFVFEIIPAKNRRDGENWQHKGELMTCDSVEFKSAYYASVV